ncbi:LysE family translocator [Peribacillus butanolivorans]|uniref:LysE family translocator n=1 Tax=Peribacillus butanolivorans TaxID=421767 RepID=UPI0037C9EA8F
MLGITSFGLFLLTAFLMNITPGTDTMYIVSKSVSQGRKAGIYSVLGISTGSLVHTFLAAVGLSVILTTSVVLFTAIKILGAAYLIYLGVKMLFQSSSNMKLSATKDLSIKKIYMQGFITNVANPKVALFFISFLPQFIATDNSYGPFPFIILGLSFVMTGTIWCLIVANFSSYITKKLRNNSKIEYLLNKLTGIIFIGLGIKLFQTKAP